MDSNRFAYRSQLELSEDEKLQEEIAAGGLGGDALRDLPIDATPAFNPPRFRGLDIAVMEPHVDHQWQDALAVEEPNAKQLYMRASAEPLFVALPERPAYVEPHTSFSSPAFPDEIQRAVESFFSTLPNTHTTTEVETHCLQGVTYSGAAYAKFSVNLYRNEDNTCLVECQRLCGCGVTFSRMYRALLEHLARNAPGILSKEDESLAAPAPLGQGQRQLPAPAISLDAETATQLIDMASCGMVDVMRESLSVLALASSTDSNRAVLLRVSGIAESLQSFLESEDAEVLRTAGTVVANLCSLPAGRQALAKLAPRIAEVLASGLEHAHSTAEARRQLSVAQTALRAH
jgi:hypothetical protein